MCEFARNLSDDELAQYMQSINSEFCRRAGIDTDALSKSVEKSNDPTIEMALRDVDIRFGDNVKRKQ
jgi:hypothetical protein